MENKTAEISLSLSLSLSHLSFFPLFCKPIQHWLPEAPFTFMVTQILQVESRVNIQDGLLFPSGIVCVCVCVCVLALMRKLLSLPLELL